MQLLDERPPVPPGPPEVGEPPRRTLPAGHVLIVGLICFGLAALLNAQSLQATANRQHFGFGRTVMVNLVRPIVAVSTFLQLDEPRHLLDGALGKEDFGVASPPTSTTIPSPTTTVAGVTTTVPDIDRRPVSAAEPLRMWVIGDSFAELFGPALVNRGADTGVVDGSVDFRFISGLTRPDYFNWPAYMAQQLPVVQPDVVVVVFGGNDGQDIYEGGQVLTVGSPEWQAVYAARVGEAMDVLTGGATEVYWMGLPIMSTETFSQKAAMMNAIYQTQADARPAVTYVDIWDLFSAPGGGYSAYLTGTDGKERLYRTGDGAHFNWNGAYRAADEVMSRISADWGFPFTVP